MAWAYCRLDNGVVVQYDAAFPLNSTTGVSNELKYIGTGVIIRVGGNYYNGRTRLNFYITKKKVKYNGKANSNDRCGTC